MNVEAWIAEHKPNRELAQILRLARSRAKQDQIETSDLFSAYGNTGSWPQTLNIHEWVRSQRSRGVAKTAGQDFSLEAIEALSEAVRINQLQGYRFVSDRQLMAVLLCARFSHFTVQREIREFTNVDRLREKFLNMLGPESEETSAYREYLRTGNMDRFSPAKPAQDSDEGAARDVWKW